MRSLMLAILVWGLAGMCVQAQAGEWDLNEMKQYYEAQVVWEIDHCLQKCHLMDSRSPVLRDKARRETGKAVYLRTYKDVLVEEMVRTGIGLNHHKIQQFLNRKYHDHGYAYLDGRYCR